MLATNVLSECCFSALKRTKTNLQSITTDSRLSKLLALHTHKEAIIKIN